MRPFPAWNTSLKEKFLIFYQHNIHVNKIITDGQETPTPRTPIVVVQSFRPDNILVGFIPWDFNLSALGCITTHQLRNLKKT